MNELSPKTGQWYLRRDGVKFEVIDIDDDGSIEVQDQDGMLDEIDADEWLQLDLEIAAQSEDSTAAFDNVPSPDEADGGDPIEIVASAELQRVTDDDRINGTTDIDADEEDPASNRPA